MPKQKDNFQEIYLIDYIKVILRNKLWLFWIFAGFMALALTLTILTPKTYESQAIIKVGNLNNVPLEPPDELIAILKSKDSLRKIAEACGIQNPDDAVLEKLSQQLTFESKKNLIIIQAQEKSPKKSQKLALGAMKFILEKHSKIFHQKQTLFDLRIKGLEEQIENNNRRFTSLGKKIDALGLPNNQAHAIVLSSYLDNEGKTQQNLDVLKADLGNIKFMKNGDQDTAPSSYPSLPNKKIKPSLKMNLLAGGILGLFTGLFWVFCLEWWKNNKEELKQL